MQFGLGVSVSKLFISMYMYTYSPQLLSVSFCGLEFVT